MLHIETARARDLSELRRRTVREINLGGTMKPSTKS